MAKGLFEIEQRLNQWASYKLLMNRGQIGWPSKNLLISMTESTGARYPTTGVCLILKYDYSQQTENWIRIMGRSLPELEDAVVIYYTSNMPIAKAAALISISRRTLMQRLHDAKLWLSGRLSEFEEAKIRQDRALGLGLI